MTSSPAQAPPASAAAATTVAPRARAAWSRVWSTDAALRALRATLVVPGLFAVADQLFGNLQMATYAAFGGFATLVMSSFGGTRRDKAAAHLGLALTGTALVVIGTLVSSSALLASLGRSGRGPAARRGVEPAPARHRGTAVRT